MPSVTVQSAVIGASVLSLAGAISAYWFYWRNRKRQNSPPAEWREVAKLTKIHLYPLKSGRRIELQRAEAERYGLVQCRKDEKNLQLRDRSFLVYGEENDEFKTARTFPKMVLIEVAVYDEDHVSFDAPGMRQLYVKIPKIGEAAEKKITLHQKEVAFGLDCGDEAAAWFSRYIYSKETGLRLAFHDASLKHQRDISKAYKTMINNYNELPESTGLFSDLTALLLLNQASVDDLNSKIHSDTVITPEHFRPNLIVEGGGAPPYVEDYWQWIKIGGAIFKNVKPSTRCMFTTINPETGIRNTNREPLKTLETYRKVKDVMHIDYEGELTVMGFNMCVYQTGEINVNDTVYVGI